LHQKLAFIFAAEQQTEMFGSSVKVLDNMGARLKPACSKHLAQFGEMLVTLLWITTG
jgi:hypothetical protein